MACDNIHPHTLLMCRICVSSPSLSTVVHEYQPKELDWFLNPAITMECQVTKSKIKYLGLIIDENGVKTDLHYMYML